MTHNLIRKEDYLLIIDDSDTKGDWYLKSKDNCKGPNCLDR